MTTGAINLVLEFGISLLEFLIVTSHYQLTLFSLEWNSVFLNVGFDISDSHSTSVKFNRTEMFV